MRGFEHLTEGDAAKLGKQAVAKPSKYRNAKVVVDGATFDSKREANYWFGLKVRERLGEIVKLRHHVNWPLLAPDRVNGNDVVVAHYECDFYYADADTGNEHVVDAKGKRTQMYLLKRKWLELQDGIVIEEV